MTVGGDEIEVSDMDGLLPEEHVEEAVDQDWWLIGEWLEQVRLV
jgi:hypothetical protein